MAVALNDAARDRRDPFWIADCELCVCVVRALTEKSAMITGCRLVYGRFTPPHQRDMDQPVLLAREVQERATAGHIRYVLSPHNLNSWMDGWIE